MSASSDFLHRIQQQQRRDVAIVRQGSNYRPSQRQVDVVDEGNYTPRPSYGGAPRTQKERVGQAHRSFKGNKAVIPHIVRQYRTQHPSRIDWGGETTGGAELTPALASQKTFEGIYNNFAKNMQQYQQQVLDLLLTDRPLRHFRRGDERTR